MVDATPNPTCPGCAQLADYAAGLLSIGQVGAIEEHLRACALCRQAVIESREDETLSGRLRGALGLEEEVALRRRLQAEVAGQYEILSTIGHGGGGVVFKARDVKLSRLVAIKCPWAAAEQNVLPTVIQEARHLARINHPNIAAVYAISERPEAPFIVMEFVDGVPVTQALAGRPIAEQMEAFVCTLHAVAALHKAGLVHRDLKPGNILVDRQGRVKLVDFGIARPADSGLLGAAHGTPAYLAPEQSLGLPARPTADVFSLGIILFELLTGRRPFLGKGEGPLIAAIGESDPPLPRSLREDIPGALQAICLSALEKDPARRYASADEFLMDIERFRKAEAVWANPTLLASVLEHGIEQHVGDIRHWEKDRMISARECDYLLDKYGRLRQREEFWILDSRRISFSQVMLHLGAWSCAISAFMMLAFPWPQIGAARPVLPALLLSLLLAAGLLLWRRKTLRVAIVLLMGGAITCPIATATVLVHLHWLETGQAGDGLFSGILGNRQLLASTLAAAVLSLLLWRNTRTAAFAIISCLSAIAVATAVFSLLGLRRELAGGHVDTVAGWYLGPAAALLLVAVGWDLKWKVQPFAAPFYVAGLIILLLSMTLIARFGPTLQWLGWMRLTPGPELTRQIHCSFIANGAIYLIAGLLADRSESSPWLRWIGSVLFWLAPSHILIPILRLEDDWPIMSTNWTVPEVILPLAALAFVFASAPKQMKSFFFSGLFYLAIAVQRLTARHFENKFAWPVALAVTGLALAMIAWRWPGLFDKQSKSPA